MPLYNAIVSSFTDVYTVREKLFLENITFLVFSTIFTFLLLNMFKAVVELYVAELLTSN